MITGIGVLFYSKDTCSALGYKCSSTLSRMGNIRDPIRKATIRDYVGADREDQTRSCFYSCNDYNIRIK